MHPKVVGSDASKASASYPEAFCRNYAKLLIESWKDRGALPRRGRFRALASRPPNKLYKKQRGKFGGLAASESKRARRDAENKEAIGGMRRPVWSLERVPGLRAVGREIDHLFDEFIKKEPGPVNAGLLEAWTQKARDPDQAVVDWIKEGAPPGHQQMHPGPWRVPSERRGPASLGRS